MHSKRVIPWVLWSRTGSAERHTCFLTEGDKYTYSLSRLGLQKERDGHSAPKVLATTRLESLRLQTERAAKIFGALTQRTLGVLQQAF